MARWIIIALLIFPNIAMGGVYVSGGVDPVEIGRRIAVSSPGVITLASGSVTRSNKKISAVDGTAFIDFSTADVLTDYVTYRAKLTITDSAGKKLVGYIKAAGTGETYGSELLTNGDFENGLTGWTIGGVPNANNYVEAVSGGARLVLADTLAVYIYQSVPSDLRLCLTSIDVVDRSGMTLHFGRWDAGYGYHGIDAIGTHTVRKTNTVASLVVTGFPGWAEFTNVSMRQILSPAETGVTITSTPDGAIYDWASKDEGFNYNDAKGYSYSITTR